MSKNLLDKYDNKTLEKRNLLNKTARIQVFVESEDDVPFWSYILIECGLKNVHISPYTNVSSQQMGIHRGKTSVLSLAPKTGRNLILCVDSDYDYLLDGFTSTSELINTNPFIFQTYTYATENYRCWAPSLEQIVIESTLCDASELFDFEEFMSEFSEIIYVLFLYSVYYHYENVVNRNPVFSIHDFNEVIQLEKVDFLKKGKPQLENLKKRVAQQLKILPPIEHNVLEDIKKRFLQLGLTPNKTYLFVQGHAIFDKVVLMLLKPIVEYLRKSKETEFHLQAKSTKEKINKINQHRNQVVDISTVLSLNKNFKTCFLFEKIRQDFQLFVSKNHI